MQAAFQRYTDNAISKTINFNNEATVQDVRDAYWQVYETGCKGITIYRDGSREKQVLETKKEGSYYDQLAGKKKAVAAGGAEVATISEPVVAGVPVEMKPRPDVLSGYTYKVLTPVGSAYISINEDEEGNIFEVFINLGRAGSDITADAEAIGRLMSLAFRIPSFYSSDRIAQNVADQLTGIGGSSSAGFGPQRVRSLADAVARALREHENKKAGLVQMAAPAGPSLQAEAPASSSEAVQAGPVASTVPASTSTSSSSNLADMCPDCGNASLRFIEGCQKCEICGFSKC
jgi:ribonucleoside-diphosphate reductase alpha chain